MRPSQAGKAEIFAALGDETRIKLVSRLCVDGPQSITALASGAKVTRQGITKHLRVMEHAGLVRSHRDGREVIWELEKRRLVVAQNYLNQISRQWDDALARLKILVEG
jgi:DNA-binding transcriptional ArsR family regulator